MSYYEALWAELRDDPLARGYASMSDEEAADDLNTAYRTEPRMEITKAQLWENTDLAEYAALTAAGRQAYDVLVNLDDIDVSEGTNSRDALAALFPAGSTTRVNLVALVTDPLPITRAEELGLVRVKPGHVRDARLLGV